MNIYRPISNILLYCKYLNRGTYPAGLYRRYQHLSISLRWTEVCIISEKNVKLGLNYFPPQAENAVLDLTRLCRFRVWAACLATLACEFLLFPLCTSDCASEYSSELRFTRWLPFEMKANKLLE